MRRLGIFVTTFAMSLLASKACGQSERFQRVAEPQVMTAEERGWLDDIMDSVPSADRAEVKENWLKMSHQARKDLYSKIELSPPVPVDFVTEDEAKWLRVMTANMTPVNAQAATTLWKFMTHNKRREAIKDLLIATLPTIKETSEEQSWLAELVKDRALAKRSSSRKRGQS